MLKKLIISLLILLIILPPTLYYFGKWYSHRYASKWADTLISLDKKGLLSKKFGAAWQDVVYGDEMSKHLNRIEGDSSSSSGVEIIDGIPVDDYPSLEVVKRLNSLNKYSNRILVTDKYGETIGQIRTDHKRASYDSLPQTLVKAVVGAEDSHFFENNYGFEYDSFIRAIFRSLLESGKSLSLKSPKGTSTITQQVGKMFVSQLDGNGQRFVARSIDRKLREIRIAAALRKLYSGEEIMEIYLNHCLTSSYGLIGAADISEGLWGKPISTITDGEAVYLARMVKWGMNYPDKIKRQCHLDMPRMAESLGWDTQKQKEVLDEIDSLKFSRPIQVKSDYGYLMDLANHYWKEFLKIKGYSKEQMADFDILEPSSLVRKKGNMEIRLTIDLSLQQFLEKIVNNRKFGGDTTIITDVRIGSLSDTVSSKTTPKNIRRDIKILKRTRKFKEPNKDFVTVLKKGDTLVTNIKYSRLKGHKYKKSTFFYGRKPINVNGQYFAYALIDSKTGKLLAYYSRDKIGSRVASLIRRKTPNGSSVAKPILNAMMLDTKKFKPYDKWDDSKEPTDSSLSWYWKFKWKKDSKGEVLFKNTGKYGRDYRVHNHGYHLDGESYVYDLLASSNNIFAVSTIFRLSGNLFDKKGNVNNDCFELGSLLYRMGVYDKLKKEFAGKEITGVRVYKELARFVGASVDSQKSINGSIKITDRNYSVALGTLELTLLQQLHLFNVLYNNTILNDPAIHPSLFIDSITIQNITYNLDSLDKVTRVHPFKSINSYRPSLLALHKRLIGNSSLKKYDIKNLDTLDIDSSKFDENRFYLNGPISNFAKSGTTDDILRPYNVDPSTSKKRTDYCLWNGSVRVNLSKFGSKSSGVTDITFAAVGEGGKNGRDGKTMHKYLSSSLLKKGGEVVRNGYYTNYEKYLKVFGEKIDTLISDSLNVDSNVVIDSLLSTSKIGATNE